MQELDPNCLKQKRRKSLKQSDTLDEVGNIEEKNESMDGGVAVAAVQHRPAS